MQVRDLLILMAVGFPAVMNFVKTEMFTHERSTWDLVQAKISQPQYHLHMVDS